MAQYEHVQRHVVDARYLGDYKVWLEFNDGRKGVVDLADELYGENFESLRDRARFAEFYLDYGLATIAWHNGVDFAPDYLYDKAERDALTAAGSQGRSSRSQWGYHCVRVAMQESPPGTHCRCEDKLPPGQDYELEHRPTRTVC